MSIHARRAADSAQLFRQLPTVGTDGEAVAPPLTELALLGLTPSGRDSLCAFSRGLNEPIRAAFLAFSSAGGDDASAPACDLRLRPTDAEGGLWQTSVSAPTEELSLPDVVFRRGLGRIVELLPAVREAMATELSRDGLNAQQVAELRSVPPRGMLYTRDFHVREIRLTGVRPGELSELETFTDGLEQREVTALLRQLEAQQAEPEGTVVLQCLEWHGHGRILREQWFGAWQ